MNTSGRKLEIWGYGVTHNNPESTQGIICDARMELSSTICKTRVLTSVLSLKSPEIPLRKATS